MFTSTFNFFQVFSAFGFVHKIATFEKAAGFQVGHQLYWCFVAVQSHYGCMTSSFFWFCLQALIQFSDAETASSARNALDGRSIPRYALYQILPIMEFIEIGTF